MTHFINCKINSIQTSLTTITLENMDSNHSTLLYYVLNKSTAGDIKSVIDSIDEFAWKKDGL